MRTIAIFDYFSIFFYSSLICTLMPDFHTWYIYFWAIMIVYVIYPANNRAVLCFIHNFTLIIVSVHNFSYIFVSLFSKYNSSISIKRFTSRIALINYAYFQAIIVFYLLLLIHFKASQPFFHISQFHHDIFLFIIAVSFLQ
jgi:hypothetical protein